MDSLISDEALSWTITVCKWPTKSDHTRCGIQAEADALCGSVSRKSGVGLGRHFPNTKKNQKIITHMPK